MIDVRLVPHRAAHIVRIERATVVETMIGVIEIVRETVVDVIVLVIEIVPVIEIVLVIEIVPEIALLETRIDQGQGQGIGRVREMTNTKRGIKLNS